MCGIFGIVLSPNTKYSKNKVNNILRNIAILSESRGKDSSGVAFRNYKSQSINIVKGDVPIRTLLETKEFDNEIINCYNSYYENDFPYSAFGHARLVTNGSQLEEVNNQPIDKDDIIMIHNGIIVNIEDLWNKNPHLKRDYKIDTEIIPTLIRDELNNGNNVIDSINNSFSKLQGTFSIAMMFNDFKDYVIATNNGSLYYITDEKNFLVFASEGYFLKKLNLEKKFNFDSQAFIIKQIKPNSGLIFNIDNFNIEKFKFNSQNNNYQFENENFIFETKKIVIENQKTKSEIVIDPSIYINRTNEQDLYSMLEYNIDAIKKLKRCTKCLLPETFPFIEYDEKGVCNYCKNHKSISINQNIDKIKEIIKPFKSKDGSPDCIVPFSGGRDSTYSLHIIVKELGLNPITFTYDWGMVTDLARRNIARVCGKLGVENIIVSANIHWKRQNINKNVNAWLRRPELGMIPLFMAGDKYFHYYCNKIKSQNGISLNIWGANDLENTNFKTGFAGLPPKFDKKRLYSIGVLNTLKLFGYFSKNFILTPSYFNKSIFDTIGSFLVRNISKKTDYYHLFDYYPWSEEEVEKIIINEYDWEKAIDTNSTWRIGDGTASFYNYIYFTVAGFSEFDTFRSNQIREGMITREKALSLIYDDNLPRYETLRWYLEIIGLDFKKVIKKVNDIPKLYKI